MVTIINCHLRQNKDGKSFVALELQGDVEMVQSLGTGKFYATARRCSIPSTFTEEAATALIGKELPGSIVRTACEAYDYKVPETGEVIRLSHTYQYLPPEATISKEVGLPSHLRAA